MSARAHLVPAMGAVAIALEDDRALLAALTALDAVSATVRTELEARLAPPAPALPADCTEGHTWRSGFGRDEAGLVARRECLVCGATETQPYTPPAYRRGATR